MCQHGQLNVCSVNGACNASEVHLPRRHANHSWLTKLLATVQDNRKRRAPVTQLARASMLIKEGGNRSDPSTVRATSAGRKGSIFSTMSARSLGDAGQRTAYATATKVGALR